MKNRLLMSAPLMTVLLISSALALSAGAYSLRGSNGDIVQINGISDFVYESASFSAYLSPGSAGTGQGSVILQARTTDRETIRMGVKLINPVVEIDNANTLKVSNDGYFYQRVKTWNGFWTTEKVEGKVTYILNKKTGLTTVVGTNGLNFKVTDLQTVNLK